MQKIFIFIAVILTAEIVLGNLISNYPENETVNLRVFISTGASKVIDTKFKPDEPLSSICDPKTRNKYKLIVHGFAESWNMSYRWNWMAEIKREVFKAPDASQICFIAVDWAGLAKGGSLVANYWKAIDNMEIAGNLMADYFKANRVQESNVHCVGFSLGAHACSMFYKAYLNKFGTKLGRITGLDPAGPFFKAKPINEKIHFTDADFVDIIHTSEQFGLSEKNGHMDFYPDSGPSSINACNDITVRFENDDNNVILYEEKVEISKSQNKSIEYEDITLDEKFTNKHGGLSGITRGSITSYLSGIYGKIKNVFAYKPKRIFSKVHQFVGCSHLMAMRFFIYSINDCEYRAVHCHSAKDFNKHKCPKNDLKAFPRMGYRADESDELYRKSMGNFFLYSYEKPPYCLKTSNTPRKNITQFYQYFLDNLKPKTGY